MSASNRMLAWDYHGGAPLTQSLPSNPPRQFYHRMGALPDVMRTGEAPSYASWFSDPEVSAPARIFLSSRLVRCAIDEDASPGVTQPLASVSSTLVQVANTYTRAQHNGSVATAKALIKRMAGTVRASKGST